MYSSDPGGLLLFGLPSSLIASLIALVTLHAIFVLYIDSMDCLQDHCLLYPGGNTETS